LATFHVAGEISPDQVKTNLETLLGSWKHDEVPAPSPEAKQIELKGRIFFVDMPGATQSYIMAGKKGMPRGSEIYYPATVVNFRLGEGTGSRLFRVLRLEKGYTYGAYSSFSSQNFKNLFIASSSVQGSVTAESVSLFKELIGGYKDSFNEEDLDMTKSSQIRRKAGSYETLSAQLNLLTEISAFNLPMDFIKQNETFTKNLTLEQAQTIIDETIREPEMIYVVVGDAKSQFANLKKCGMGDPILMDREGNPVK
ncbi:MAG: insulinase family protein, partial [Bacteroidales bacterium]|nr:insulinase family protein [Bacteroidales bacterium]